MENYFTKNLKYIREQRNISQNKLADMIKVNQTTIARWEDENRIPTIEKAIEVSNALNIPLDDLIGKDLSLEDNSVTESDIDKTKENIKNLNTLSEEEKNTLLGLLDFYHSRAVEDKKGGEK